MTARTSTQSAEGGSLSQQHPRRYRPSLAPGLSAALLLFVAVFWIFLAIRLQEVDFDQTPLWWLAQVDAFPLLAFVPPAFVTFLSELFSWHVFRHILIPALMGWWLAGQAAVGFVRSFYNFGSRAEAASFLSGLERHSRSGSARRGPPTVRRSAGRVRLGPVYKLLLIMTPMALTFMLLLLVAPFLPPSPTRTVLYNSLIIISGAATFIAIGYFAIDAFTGGPPAAGGLRLHHETLEALRRQHSLLRVGGPGKVLVPDHEVAVTEYNARCYRVLGPGAQSLLPFEYVRSMIDLRSQEREGEVSGLTRDGVEVACHIAVTFRLSPDDRYVADGVDGSPVQEQRSTRDRPYPYGEQAARTAAYIETVDGEGRVSTWMAMPLVIATGEFRRALTAAPLHQLYDPDAEGLPPHPTLWKEVHNNTRDELRKLGIELVALRMGPLQPPQGVMEHNLNGWRAYWEDYLNRLRVREEADAAYTVEDARTRAAVDMLRTIMHSIEHARRESGAEITQEIMALRLLEALEQAARTTATAGDKPDEAQRRIQRIRQGLLPPGDGT